jgi:hypothetical protein
MCPPRPDEMKESYTDSLILLWLERHSEGVIFACKKYSES